MFLSYLLSLQFLLRHFFIDQLRFHVTCVMWSASISTFFSAADLASSQCCCSSLQLGICFSSMGNRKPSITFLTVFYTYEVMRHHMNVLWWLISPLTWITPLRISQFAAEPCNWIILTRYVLSPETLRLFLSFFFFVRVQGCQNLFSSLPTKSPMTRQFGPPFPGWSATCQYTLSENTLISITIIPCIVRNMS